MKTKPAKGPRTKWRDEFYVAAYRYARSGMTDGQIADALGVSAETVKGWKADNPAFRDAIGQARGDGPDGQATFRDYVYAQLKPELRDIWDRIDYCEDSAEGWRRADAILERSGKTARQHLFLYALVHCSFNPSDACRKLHISRDTLNHWRDNDPEFTQLLDEIHWHKGNFFEAALVDRVMDGDVPSTLFANKTFNADRGYGERVEHKHEHHHHGLRNLKPVIRLEELDLPDDAVMALYDALCALREASKPEPLKVQAKEPPHAETDGPATAFGPDEEPVPG